MAFEAGYDGFWLARWLRARGIEAYVIHPTSIPVSREQRRAKTDRLDTALLMRAVLGWLRGEPKHCNMVAIPTLAEEDARRPSRERETLVQDQTRIVNRMKATLVRFGSVISRSSCARQPPVWKSCRARKASRYRQTRWPSCDAIWRGCA